MTVTEKAAYLKGLIEGRGMDTEAGEGKLWRVLSELVGDLAGELTELRKDHADLADSVDKLAEDVEFLEEIYDYDEDFDSDEDGYYPFGNYEDAEDGEDEDGDDVDVSYEVECPNCGKTFSFDEETLVEGAVPCPNCGTALEFELLDPDEDEDGEE